ncbi:hypothetical protein BT69DRAFT_1219092, partial [Atractiella rhizophila]
LSLDRIKRCIKEKSHIMPEAFDMCPNSCIVYTGEWSEFMECPKCHLSRYREATSKPGGKRKKKVPRQQYFVVPFEAPLQARWATEEGVSASKHRARRTKDLLEKCPQDGMLPDILDDIYCGSDYLKLAREKKILPSDTILAFSLDGAQVFNNKTPSDAIFVIGPLKVRKTLQRVFIKGYENTYLSDFLRSSVWNRDELQEDVQCDSLL